MKIILKVQIDCLNFKNKYEREVKYDIYFMKHIRPTLICFSVQKLTNILSSLFCCIMGVLGI